MLTDQEIIAGCQNGRQEAYRMLVEKYAARLMAVCMRYLKQRQWAEDALQDGFILVFQHIQKYANKGTLYSWLKKIMVNHCLKQLRKNKVWLNVDDHHKEEATTDYQPEIDDDLENALMNLPEAYRLVFNLYVVEGYSHAEIGDIMDITESSSRVYLTRARMYLKTYLFKEKIS